MGQGSVVFVQGVPGALVAVAVGVVAALAARAGVAVELIGKQELVVLELVAVLVALAARAGVDELAGSSGAAWVSF